jgi:hypothetical protein
MKRQIAEWLWRALVLCLLGVIALQLRQVHEDIVSPPPTDETSTTAQAPDEALEGIEAIREDVAQLAQKVDAILVVMARPK